MLSLRSSWQNGTEIPLMSPAPSGDFVPLCQRSCCTPTVVVIYFVIVSAVIITTQELVNNSAMNKTTVWNLTMCILQHIFIIIIVIISFMQGIHTYTPETSYVSGVYSVAAILCVLLMVHITLSSILNSLVLLH
jgi:hypothetical protein